MVDVHKDRQMIYDMLGQAAEQEIKWAKGLYGNRIMGISEKSSEAYVKYLANLRVKALGLPSIYEEVANPYKHLEGAKERNFFETTVTDYSMADSVGGWDEF